MKKKTPDTTHWTERTAAARLCTWLETVSTEQGLGFGSVVPETGGRDGKFPDIIIYETPRNNKVVALIEAKLPSFDAYDLDLRDTAARKAIERKARYFGVTNFRKIIWYDTQQVRVSSGDDCILGEFTLSDIRIVDDLKSSLVETKVKQGILRFLEALHACLTGTRPIPKLSLDDKLVARLHEKIRVLSQHYRATVENEYHNDRSFARKMRQWFAKQNWEFADQPQYFEKAARQAAYVLMNKVLFYTLLQTKKASRLDPIELAPHLSQGSMMRRSLRAHFDAVLEIDYKTVYTEDFLDDIAMPNDHEVVHAVRDLLELLKRYDFSKLGYDIIGRIFERLIPREERHLLGQYFTRADVVDVILGFCLKHTSDNVLDPSCGTGTFLVRAYEHKKLENPRLTHEKILSTLWGNDIAQFPAQLATINLAIKDLSVEENYPNILEKDFFSFKATEFGIDLSDWRKGRAKTLDKEEKEVTYPHTFDVIIGNPPYIRQEDIGDLAKDENYKTQMLKTALQSTDGKKTLATISKRAGIHAYFFVHGWKFLTENGRFGFIVANSWLDVEYGRGLQEFFLKHYKIRAIIESKVERWFGDASVNTCIIILEKCTNEDERMTNMVRFVSLKRPLDEFVPAAEEGNLGERWRGIRELRQQIENQSERFEDDELMINPVLQSELFNEGLDETQSTFVGSKWGKYLRAPRVYFETLKKSKSLFTKLGQLASVRFGVKSGANEFFYLTSENISRRSFEKEIQIGGNRHRGFLQPIVFSLKEVAGYKVERSSLKRYAIICDKPKSKIKNAALLKYIELGERKKYNQRPTCESRTPWYSLASGWEPAPLIFPAKVGERLPVILNDGVLEDKKFYGITPFNTSEAKLLAALLNSTLTRFFIEFSSRQLTGAQAIADIDVAVVEELFIVNPASIEPNTRARLELAFDDLLETSCDSILSELGPIDKTSGLDSVKKERRAIDRIVMGELLGMREAEQIEVYRAVVDLVRTRIERSRTATDEGALEEGLNQELFIEGVLSEISERLGDYYKATIHKISKKQKITLPQATDVARLVHELDGWKIYFGKKVLDCRNELEAEYIKTFLDAGMTEVYMPLEESKLHEIVPTILELRRQHAEVIEEHLRGIPSAKLRSKLRSAIWSYVMIGNAVE